jgi:mannose-1-phosphate guanylyltransferase
MHQLYGEHRPKQFAVLGGSKSLLRQTLDRTSLLAPAKRTVVVSVAGQASYLTTELDQQADRPRVIEQPRDRGTAAAILVAAHWILARDRHAVVVMLPSDHFVGDDAAFIERVSEMSDAAVDFPDRIFLLGARPSEPEPEYGWIEPGGPLAACGRPDTYQVRRFVEKPAPAEATRLLDSGGLWNTFVLAARAATLVEAGREHVPDLHDHLVTMARQIGHAREEQALRLAYELAAGANFSHDVLERCPARLGVVALSNVSWSDLGTPRRVVKMLEETGSSRRWLARARAI